MSNADQLRVSFVEEITFGTTPLASLIDLRILSESLKQDTGTTRSAEIQSSRETTAVVRTQLSASGGIQIELSYGTFDLLMEATLQSADWAGIVTMAAGPSMTIASNVITRGTGDFTADGFLVNRWIRMTGWTDAANNTYAKISVVGTTTMTVVGPTLVDDVSAETDIEIEMGDQIVNGTEFRSFSIERHYTDLSSQYSIFTGMAPDQFTINVQAEQIITGSFEFLGRDEASGTSSAGSGYTTAPTGQPVNAVEDVEAIFEGSTLAAVSLIGFSFTQQNNLRQRPEIAQLGPDSLGSGKCVVAGTFQGYYETATLFDRYLNFTDTALAFSVEDALGNAYLFDFPRVKLSNGQRVGGGENSDIIADMAFEAYRHETELVTIRIQRWAV